VADDATLRPHRRHNRAVRPGPAGASLLQLQLQSPRPHLNQRTLGRILSKEQAGLVSGGGLLNVAADGHALGYLRAVVGLEHR
jgi:hypothetical protein